MVFLSSQRCLILYIGLVVARIEEYIAASNTSIIYAIALQTRYHFTL